MSNPPNRDPEAVVERLVQEVHERVLAIVEAWCTKVRQDAAATVVDVLSDAANAHEKIIAEIDWNSSGAEAAYRKAFSARVLTPLRVRLGEESVEGRLQDAHQRLLDRLAAAGTAVPATLSRPEPESLYRSEKGDRVITRAQKAGVRVGRTWRSAVRTITTIPRSFKAQQDAEEPSDPEQTIPLKLLAEYHLKVRIPNDLDIIQEALHQVLGRAIEDVARSVTEHGHEILLAERGEALDKEAVQTAKPPAAPLPDEQAQLLESSTSTHEGAESQDAITGGSIRDAAEDFNAALRRAQADADVEDILKDAERKCDEAVERFRRDVHQSDTFMLDLENRQVDGRVPSREAREESWRAWQVRVLDRIELTEMLFSIREEALDLGTTFTRRVLENAIQPAKDALAQAERSLSKQAAKASKEFSAGSTVADRIRRHLDEALQVVEQELIRGLREANYPQKTREIAETTASEFASDLDELPVKIDINALRPSEERAIDPTADPFEVEIREHASRAYDAIVLRRLHSAAAVVANGLREARETVEGIPDILQFNLKSALEEIESNESSDLSSARELAVGGLERSANVLRETSQALTDLHDPFRQQVDDIIEYGFDSLHERLRVEVRMRGQILDLRSGAVEQMRDISSRAAEQARRSSVLLKRAYQRGVRRGRALLEMGQAAAGLAEATEEERLETVEALADVGRLMEQLPLVYRRLFSFQPSTDASMIGGRESDFAFIRRHVDLWARELTTALVLHGHHGCGLTTVLNIVRKLILEDAEVTVLDLRTRIPTEEELSTRLAETLGLDVGSHNNLDSIERALRATESPKIRACFVEHIEHLYLRQIGGTQLIEKFLAFMSRTDARVLWIATASDTAWQVISTAEPSAAGLVTSHGLSAITRDELEAIVLSRHKRSGLPLHFEPPEKEINPIIARRYRRASTEQEKQDVLQEEYFDRLSRASGQNIMLALLYWLRSVEMDPDEGRLRVGPLQALSFLSLEKFDLDRAFALKALLEHTSLTVEEHSELSQRPVETSLQLFQNLGNLLLIEPFENEDRGRFQFFTVEEGVRYRVRPLLIHPVTRFLRNRNILH